MEERRGLKEAEDMPLLNRYQYTKEESFDNTRPKSWPRSTVLGVVGCCALLLPLWVVISLILCSTSSSYSHFATRSVLALLFARGCAANEGTSHGSTTPNLLVIVVDDLGWADAPFMGSVSSVDMRNAMPHISSLANAGVILKSFYVSPSW